MNIPSLQHPQHPTHTPKVDIMIRNANPYRELGGIQLHGYEHWRSLGDSFWNERGAKIAPRRNNVWGFYHRSDWNYRRYLASRNMERLEKNLHAQGEETQEVSLVARRYEKVSHPTTHYHADLLPRWEAFAEAQSSNEDPSLEHFSIVRVQLPPAPFFSQKLMPVINNSRDTLTTLQLRGCDLVSKDIVPISRFIKNNSTLNTLDIEVKMDSMRDTKSLSKAIKNHPELAFVSLAKCGLGADVKILKVVLDGVCNVKSLLLEGNDIGVGESDGLDLVANFLTNNKNVTLFSIADNGIVGKKKTEVLSKVRFACHD